LEGSEARDPQHLVNQGDGDVTARTTDGVLRTAELLLEARRHERAGRIREAMDCCMAAVAEAAWCGAWAAQAVGLRRLGVLHNQRNEIPAARETCRTSVEVALRAGEPSIAVEALLALGDLELEHGNFTAAQESYQEALTALHEERTEVRTRIDERLARLAEARAKADRAA
jgi:tetratricopeptide (TPR) repeat protein